MRTCKSCGRTHADGTRRCVACGESLADATSRTHGLEQAPAGAAGLHEPWLWQPSQIGRRQPKTPRKSGASTTTRTTPRHFLVPPFGGWVKLEARAGAVLVIGRDESCAMQVRAKTVSRRHAQLRFEGNPLTAFLSDLGTVNGTRVNGQPISGERALVDGDTVRVGDVTAVYRLLAPNVLDTTLAGEGPKTELLETTVPLGKTRASGKLQPFSLDLAGDIAQYPMPELIARLGMLQANGTFVVEVDGLAGLVRFEQGQVVEAILGELAGEPALAAISALRRGRFRFVPQAQKPSVERPDRRPRATPPQGVSAR